MVSKKSYSLNNWITYNARLMKIIIRIRKGFRIEKNVRFKTIN